MAKTGARLRYSGAWFNDAHLGLQGGLTKDYEDYFTFFLPPLIRPGVGEAADVELTMHVAHHHVSDGSRRVLAETTRRLRVVGGGDADAGGAADDRRELAEADDRRGLTEGLTDAASLDVSAVAPVAAGSGDAGVDAELALAGVPRDAFDAAVVEAAAVDAAGVVGPDRVRVTSVAFSGR